MSDAKKGVKITIMDKRTENIVVSSGKYEDEKKYWMNQFGEVDRPSEFFYDKSTGIISNDKAIYKYQFPKALSKELFSLCNNSEYGTFIVLLTGVVYIMYEFTADENILIGVPMLKEDTVKEHINEILAISTHINTENSFKEYVTMIKEKVNSAFNNQTFPLGYVFEELNLPLDNGKPSFKTIAFLDNIQNRDCIDDKCAVMVFEFSIRGSSLLLNVKYSEYLHEEETVRQIVNCLSGYFQKVLRNPGVFLKDVNVLSDKDKLAYRKKKDNINLNSEANETLERDILKNNNAAEELVEPRNELEIEMVELWREVLGVPKIGINNNFFSLGGDSIKAIRLAAMLWKYGIRVRDVYNYPTIAELTSNVQMVVNTISQEPVEGEVLLTPIQQWFFDQKIPNQSHYNQSVFIHKREGFDVNIVREVLKKIIEHHDVLRMNYIIKNGNVLQYNAGLEKVEIDLSVIDLKEYENYPDKVTQEANKAHTQIDISSGKLIKLVLFNTNDGDHLLIIIHHLVVDGISWRIILEDFARAYLQGINDQSIVFPDKTNSYKDWAVRLLDYSNSEELLKEIDYWKEIQKVEIQALLDNDKAYNSRIKDRTEFTIVLSEEETNRVKSASNKLNISIDSILLSALGLSIKEWIGLEKILVDMEGHGRKDVIDDINITRTVGWFTTIYPVILNSEDAVYIECVNKVNDMLKNVQNKGFDYSILKYLTAKKQPDLIDLDLKADVCFNYLGEFDQDIDTELFRISNLYSGRAFDAETPINYVFEINGIIIEKKLKFNIIYSEQQYNNQDIAKFAKACKKYILEIGHCEDLQDNAYKSLPIKKKLDGIEPFNEIFYKDCFFNSFFAVANYFKRNGDRIFANDTFVYSQTDKKDPLNLEVEYITDEALVDLIEQCGIKTRNVVISNDIIRDIKMAIAFDKPAVVSVDCYYEPIRRDTYQKKHWAHMLLVYGYDDSQQVLNIIEHTDINGLDYTHKTIAYEDMIECYNGLHANFNIREGYPSFMEFYAEDTNFISDNEIKYHNILARNMMKNKEILFTRLKRIKEFEEEVNSVIISETDLSLNIDKLSFIFTELLKAKYAETYRISKIIEIDAGVNESMNKIINSIKLMKNIIDKYKYSKIYREKSIKTISDEFSGLYDLEVKYYSQLFTLLEQIIL